jgi:hypothetical protein
MRVLLRLLVFSVLLGLLLPSQAFAFTDTVASPYREAIGELAVRDIIAGYEDGTFRPANPVWRAQFAKMIVGTLGLEVEESDTLAPFSDLGPDHPNSLYPHEYVAAAYFNGITTGKTATTFAPWEETSRAQVITMVVRALDRLSPGLLVGPPVDFPGSWGVFSNTHAPSARKAEYNFLLERLGRMDLDSDGEVATLDPWAAMPRGEVAQILCNLISAPKQIQAGTRVINPSVLPRARFFGGYVEELTVGVGDLGAWAGVPALPLLLDS